MGRVELAVSFFLVCVVLLAVFVLFALIAVFLAFPAIALLLGATAAGAGDGALDFLGSRPAGPVPVATARILVRLGYLAALTLVAVGGESGGRGVVPRVPTREDRAALGEANDRSGDGGASWWTAALPGASEYCPGY